MTDEMAERIARAEFRHLLVRHLWDGLSDRIKMERIEHWRGVIYKIRAAGLAVVEAEDGR